MFSRTGTPLVPIWLEAVSETELGGYEKSRLVSIQRLSRLNQKEIHRPLELHEKHRAGLAVRSITLLLNFSKNRRNTPIPGTISVSRIHNYESTFHIVTIVNHLQKARKKTLQL